MLPIQAKMVPRQRAYMLHPCMVEIRSFDHSVLNHVVTKVTRIASTSALVNQLNLAHGMMFRVRSTIESRIVARAKCWGVWSLNEIARKVCALQSSPIAIHFPQEILAEHLRRLIAGDLRNYIKAFPPASRARQDWIGPQSPRNLAQKSQRIVCQIRGTVVLQAVIRGGIVRNKYRIVRLPGPHVRTEVVPVKLQHFHEHLLTIGPKVVQPEFGKMGVRISTGNVPVVEPKPECPSDTNEETCESKTEPADQETAEKKKAHNEVSGNAKDKKKQWKHANQTFIQLVGRLLSFCEDDTYQKTESQLYLAGDLTDLKIWQQAHVSKDGQETFGFVIWPVDALSAKSRSQFVTAHERAAWIFDLRATAIPNSRVSLTKRPSRLASMLHRRSTTRFERNLSTISNLSTIRNLVAPVNTGAENVYRALLDVRFRARVAAQHSSFILEMLAFQARVAERIILDSSEGEKCTINSLVVTAIPQWQRARALEERMQEARRELAQVEPLRIYIDARTWFSVSRANGMSKRAQEYNNPHNQSPSVKKRASHDLDTIYDTNHATANSPARISYADSKQYQQNALTGKLSFLSEKQCAVIRNSHKRDIYMKPEDHVAMSAQQQHEKQQQPRSSRKSTITNTNLQATLPPFESNHKIWNQTSEVARRAAVQAKDFLLRQELSQLQLDLSNIRDTASKRIGAIVRSIRTLAWTRHRTRAARTRRIRFDLSRRTHAVNFETRMRQRARMQKALMSYSAAVIQHFLHRETKRFELKCEAIQLIQVHIRSFLARCRFHRALAIKREREQKAEGYFLVLQNRMLVKCIAEWHMAARTYFERNREFTRIRQRTAARTLQRSVRLFIGSRGALISSVLNREQLHPALAELLLQFEHDMDVIGLLERILNELAGVVVIPRLLLHQTILVEAELLERRSELESQPRFKHPHLHNLNVMRGAIYATDALCTSNMFEKVNDTDVAPDTAESILNSVQTMSSAPNRTRGAKGNHHHQQQQKQQHVSCSNLKDGSPVPAQVQIFFLRFARRPLLIHQANTHQFLLSEFWLFLQSTNEQLWRMNADKHMAERLEEQAGERVLLSGMTDRAQQPNNIRMSNTDSAQHIGREGFGRPSLAAALHTEPYLWRPASSLCPRCCAMLALVTDRNRRCTGCALPLVVLERKHTRAVGHMDDEYIRTTNRCGTLIKPGDVLSSLPSAMLLYHAAFVCLLDERILAYMVSIPGAQAFRTKRRTVISQHVGPLASIWWDAVESVRRWGVRFANAGMKSIRDLIEALKPLHQGGGGMNLVDWGLEGNIETRLWQWVQVLVDMDAECARSRAVTALLHSSRRKYGGKEKVGRVPLPFTSKLGR